MNISQVVTCRGRKSHVFKHLDRWLLTDIDELVVVDYGDPDGVTSDLIKAAEKDRRIHVVRVFPAAASFFQLTCARNVGAQAARSELLFFCDADAYCSPLFMDSLKSRFTGNDPPDLVVTSPELTEENALDPETAEIPFSWDLDGQCAIRNSLFYRLNGYNQRLAGWGGESYDLYVRARQAGALIREFDNRGLRVLAHTDDMRDAHHEERWSEVKNGRTLQFRKSLRQLRRWRKHSFRTNPGFMVGFPADPTGMLVRRYRDGKTFRWSPGDDD